MTKVPIHAKATKTAIAMAAVLVFFSVVAIYLCLMGLTVETAKNNIITTLKKVPTVKAP